MVVDKVVCVVVVCGVFSDFGGNCATVNRELAVLGAELDAVGEENELGGAGIEWAIGVVEHAGIGTTEADAKPTDVFFCASTP